MRSIVTTLVELVGFALIVTGIALISVPFALIAGGLVLAGAGSAIDRASARRPKADL